ncbi:site-specific integrase [Colwellia sp. E2M01]|uniref:site-specific integrase n=1 Tax=Colwellia sp. E2M01 TaxID=2841561 RepID=UPI001C084C5E|nr:site-specific integrase [Colwellia sp. E2M01]MBU2869742.1 site-specific integrase [Colwellia sp. E2M01]
MASISVRKDTQKLFFNFTYLGKRCREQTHFVDNVANRKQLEKQLAQIEAEIRAGVFNYAEHFPRSKKLVEFEYLEKQEDNGNEQDNESITPLFSTYINDWLEDNKLAWRKSHLLNIESIINKHYLPYFGSLEVGKILRVDIIKFRTHIAKLPGRSGRKTISNNRINKIMDPLKRIFEEAGERYGFSTPFYKIKVLKTQKSDIEPFNFSEVNTIINLVRADYKNYYVVRFFTGMRTGEIDGLKWKYVDFESRCIKVRETLVLGDDDYTKNDSSQRDIDMSAAVYKALKEQYQCTAELSEYVFCNTKGGNIDHNNTTKRVWYPLLARLKIARRRPYQTRHTTATLWLAAGESPEWIAKQMGHASTEMLFKVYSRFVPNLTRKDGSAFEVLLEKNIKL